MKNYIEKLISNALENRNIVIWKDQDRYFEEFFNEFHLRGVISINYSNSITQLKLAVEKNDPYIQNKYLIYVGSNDFDSDYEYFGRIIRVNLFDILDLKFGTKYNRNLYNFVNEYKGYISTSFDRLVEYNSGTNLSVNELKELVLKTIFETNHFNMDELVIKLMFAPNKSKLFELINKSTLLSYFYQRLEDNYGIKLYEDSLHSFIDKIAFSMIVNAFYYQANGKGMNSYETFVVLDDIKRERIFNFVDDVWRNNDKYKQDYINYCKKYQKDFVNKSLSSSVNDGIMLNDLKCDIFIDIDEKLYSEVKIKISNIINDEDDVNSLDEVYRIIKERKDTFWSKNKLFVKWTGICYLADFLYKYLEFNKLYKNKVYLKVEDIINDYINGLYYIDFNYRKFREVLTEIDIEGSIVKKVNQTYNLYLDEINYKYSLLVEQLPEFRVNGISNQQIVWSDFRKQQGKKCIIFADALSYELGKELENNLIQFNVTNTAMLSSLPSVTEVGMTRLVMNSDESMLLKGDNSGIAILTDNFNKNLAQRENRKEKMRNDIHDLQFKEISDLLMQSTDNLGDNIVVFSRDIDSIGESGASFGIEIFKNNLRDIARVINILSSKGYTVFIVSDHGYLYTVDNKPVKSPQGEYIKLSSRYGIGNNIQGEQIVKNSNWCSIESNFNIVFARGIAEYSIKGGNEDFEHGGISLQENILPYIKVKSSINPNNDIVRYKFKVPEKIKTKFVKIEITCDKVIVDLDLSISLESKGYIDKKSFSVHIENSHADIKYRLNDKLPPNNEYVTIKVFNEETQLKLHEGKIYVDLLDDKKLF